MSGCTASMRPPSAPVEVMTAVQFLAALVCLKDARDVAVRMSWNKIEPVCGVETGAEAVRMISRIVVILERVSA